MQKYIAIIAAVGILGLCKSSYGLATEQIGPDTAHPAVSQQDWRKKNGPSLSAGKIQGDPYDTLLAWGARSLPWLVLTDERHIITKAGFNLSDMK